ncbi:ABC transporter ATP-binding protein [Rummeliibacillus sp. NPDC094406]|uniref:ABC transporter ATP-binding protein n=1 Tax=Rummeliibacillus sp. NPDC094406 TaxID=3364511 RepID=UPI003826702F
MTFIELKHLQKTYNQQQFILKDINVDIQKGEFFVIVGPSGSGKSTLLNMIAGLENITAGVLTINGKEMNNELPRNRQISMVFQHYALYPHLTVEQNILFNLKMRKKSKEEQEKLLKDAVALTNLENHLSQKPHQLSGGQRQRVALARAIVNDAPICLMDEPLSNLDAQLRAQMRTEIRRIQQKLGLTILYVTHDQTEAMTMGDRIMVLHEGVVQQIGKPLDLYNHPQNLFVARFIGSPKMNIARAICQKQQLIIEGEWKIELPQSIATTLPQQKELLIGIRPEHLQKGGNLQMLVQSIEQLGHETHVTFDMPQETWAAKWSGQLAIDAGTTLSIGIDPQNIYFFDKETEKLLG